MLCALGNAHAFVAGLSNNSARGPGTVGPEPGQTNDLYPIYKYSTFTGKDHIHPASPVIIMDDKNHQSAFRTREQHAIHASSLLVYHPSSNDKPNHQVCRRWMSVR